MTGEKGKYYLYKHTRLDKSEPFYIGIGTKQKGNTYLDIYTRAFARSRRNKIWKDIVRKNKEKYEVETFLESDDYDFIKQKEREFIKLYGRIDLKTGILANMTDGGEGKTSYVTSEETKRKIGNSNRGNKKTAESLKRQSETRKNNYNPAWFDNIRKKAYQYDLDGNFIKEWRCIIDATKEHGYDNGLIIRCCKKRPNYRSAYGYMWFYEYLGEKIAPLNKHKKVRQFDLQTNETICMYKSSKEASNKLGKLQPSLIVSVCINKRKDAYGYGWEYIK